MKCFVSWVTNEPKLRPTMQCQVGPLRSSNCSIVSDVVWIRGLDSYGLLDVHGNVLERGSSVPSSRKGAS